MKKTHKVSIFLLLLVIMGLALWLLPNRETAHSPATTAVQRSANTGEVIDIKSLSDSAAPAREARSVVVAPNPAPPPANLSTPSTTGDKSSAPPSPAAKETSSPPKTPDSPEPELIASARMYSAHVSLRASEVADPDSESNRRILQTMLSKAIASRGVDATPPDPATAAR